MDHSIHKPRLRRLVSKICIAAVILYSVYVISFYLTLSMDDGPFTGAARIDCPRHSPDQVFDLSSGQQLLVFDPWVDDPAGGEEWNGLRIPNKKPNGDKAPTVALRAANGEIKWCIFATGHAQTQVALLRFQRRYRPVPFVHSYILGRVMWTFGDERMTWSIRSDGTLHWYRYSW